MADTLPQALLKLRDSTHRLNQLTNKAGDTVKAVEKYLATECSAGIEARVKYANFDAELELIPLYLAYERCGNQFRITVTGAVQDEAGLRVECRPWSEWDRDT